MNRRAPVDRWTGERLQSAVRFRGPSTIINMQPGDPQLGGQFWVGGQFPKCCLVSEQITSCWQCGTCIINGLFALSLQILMKTGTENRQVVASQKW